MADPRFFDRSGPFTLARLAEIGGASMASGADRERLFQDVAAIAEAGADEVVFLSDKSYLDALSKSRAGACVLPPDLAAKAPAGLALLLAPDAKRAFALIPATARAAHCPYRLRRSHGGAGGRGAH
jgi:UDP-3-O-[3-hydroxymyristoyl] glucosamine N-acyltransferase